MAASNAASRLLVTVGSRPGAAHVLAEQQRVTCGGTGSIQASSGLEGHPIPGEQGSPQTGHPTFDLLPEQGVHPLAPR